MDNVYLLKVTKSDNIFYYVWFENRMLLAVKYMNNSIDSCLISVIILLI